MSPGRGADDGFAAFAASQAAPLFRTAWLLTGDWHLSEDLVQEALGRMYMAWPGISRIDNPAAYSHTVLVRLFVSHRRRRSSTERPSEQLPEVIGVGSDDALRMTLASALATLPKRDRAVLVLRYFEDRSVEQVAKDLNRSPGAIRVQALRALAKLRTALGDDFLNLVRP